MYKNSISTAIKTNNIQEIKNTIIYELKENRTYYSKICPELNQSQSVFDEAFEMTIAEVVNASNDALTMRVYNCLICDLERKKFLVGMIKNNMKLIEQEDDYEESKI